jgi:hypothetical protein
MKKLKPEDEQRKVPPSIDDEDEAPVWSLESEELERGNRMKSPKKAPTHKKK